MKKIMLTLLPALLLLVPVQGFQVPETAMKVEQKSLGEEGECIQLDSQGAQHWSGKPTDELLTQGDALQELADRNQDTTTGVSYCSNYEGVAIFVTTPNLDLLKQISEIENKYPNVPVHTTEVQASLAELLNIISNVFKEFGDSAKIVDIGPHMYSGGLDIGISGEAWPLSSDMQRNINSLIEQIHGSSVPLIFYESGAPVDSTRKADSSPYWMGAELISGGAACSAGVPIYVAGSRKLLTAGHCTGTSFTNNGTVVGTQYTTSYPGNQNIYGDFKLLQGKSYALRVFSGSMSSNASLPISGGTWGARPNGSGMCVSGRTTAQTCRYFVSGTYRTFNGAGHQVRMYHDSNLDGLGDNNGWQPGDSGGPCYHANGGGGVIVNGIVKGRTLPIVGAGNATTYWCTQLSGVRAWNSSAYVG